MIRVEIEITATKEGDLKIGKRSFFITSPEHGKAQAESGLAAAMENCIDIMLAELQPADSKIIQATKMP